MLHAMNVKVLYVALLAEGVDRNNRQIPACNVARRSPSSRRAWIEIDRESAEIYIVASPSSRRAWIEISRRRVSSAKFHSVALLAEGVDRNNLVYSSFVNVLSSPSSRRAWIEITRTS